MTKFNLEATTLLSDNILEVMDRKGAACRRYLESTFCFGLNACKPKSVTDAIQYLVDAKLILKDDAPLQGALHPNTEIFISPQCSRRRLLNYKIIVDKAHQILTPRLLGRLGEDYARAIMTKGGTLAIEREVKRDKFGPVDFITRLRSQPHVEVLVQVKNRREYYHPNSKQGRFIGHIAATAIEANSLPLLIVPHMTLDALELCRHIGFPVLSMRRQIIPKSLLAHERKTIAEAFGENEPYEAVESTGRALHHELSHDCIRDIDWFRSATLEAYYGKWEQTARLLRDRRNEMDNLNISGLLRLLGQ